MKPGESRDVAVAFQVNYNVKAAGIGHLQVTATCTFHGKEFKGEGSHPVGRGYGELMTSMAGAFGNLLKEMEAEYDKHRMLPEGVLLKPEAEELRTHLMDLFDLPQTEPARPMLAPMGTRGRPRPPEGNLHVPVPRGHDGYSEPAEERAEDDEEEVEILPPRRRR